ncbi:membrane protein insertase YidC [Moraxella porci DSM 25326]|uniref:Membrane protein insertase YidC n=1 Tax=Moraxella porci DSM 25326 TaxID=573983 RepID=A0A1T0CP30_9GAMM|nr:membrane protein insertase YidC [Moraxella porci]OOS24063.1 membrane protein insertase YidC [Moraxella porci DSM 25326]
MQKILRILIIVAMLITAYLLILAWRDDYAGKPATTAPVATQTSSSADVPSAQMTGDVPSVSAGAPADQQTANLISVDTDRYEIKINPVGGDIVYAALKQHNATKDSNTPFVLLENDATRTYVAQSGLMGRDGIDTAQGRAVYTSPRTSYQLNPSAGSLQVPLVYQKDGVTITKTYTFNAGQYPINLSYNINNTSANAWQGQMYAQLKRDNSKDPGLDDKGMLGMATYLGGAWGTPDDPYNKLKFSNFGDGLNVKSKDGWVAIVQHYFVSAWTPSNSFEADFFTRTTGNEHFIGYNSPVINVDAGKQITLNSTLYAGPKIQSEMAPVAEGLNKTVDYGLLWPISKVLFAILDGIHKFIGNWGWSIVVLTLIIKIALFWLSNKSYVSMAKMRAIAPKLQALKDKHGDDRMAMSQEMMQLYRDEKVNPMAGCLPILIQMPIFLGLYWMLVESVELRHAPWIGWITDLSAMDPWFILPIFMGVTMYVQQLLNPQPTDPMQAKMMKILPLVFAIFMLWFPAGLVLYWTVNNLFSMIHQHLVNKRVAREMQAKQA